MADDKTAAERAAEERYPLPAGDKPLTDAHSIASAAVAGGLNIQARMAFVNGARWATEQAARIATEMARPSVAEAIREELL